MNCGASPALRVASTSMPALPRSSRGGFSNFRSGRCEPTRRSVFRSRGHPRPTQRPSSNRASTPTRSGGRNPLLRGRGCRRPVVRIDRHSSRRPRPSIFGERFRSRRASGPRPRFHRCPTPVITPEPTPTEEDPPRERAEGPPDDDSPAPLVSIYLACFLAGLLGGGAWAGWRALRGG